MIRSIDRLIHSKLRSISRVRFFVCLFFFFWFAALRRGHEEGADSHAVHIRLRLWIASPKSYAEPAPAAEPEPAPAAAPGPRLRRMRRGRRGLNRGAVDEHHGVGVFPIRRTSFALKAVRKIHKRAFSTPWYSRESKHSCEK